MGFPRRHASQIGVARTNDDVFPKASCSGSQMRPTTPPADLSGDYMTSDNEEDDDEDGWPDSQTYLPIIIISFDSNNWSNKQPPSNKSDSIFE